MREHRLIKYKWKERTWNDPGLRAMFRFQSPTGESSRNSIGLFFRAFFLQEGGKYLSANVKFLKIRFGDGVCYLNVEEDPDNFTTARI